MPFAQIIALVEAAFADIQPALVPAEIAALQALESTVKSPVAKALIDAAIAYLESQKPAP